MPKQPLELKDFTGGLNTKIDKNDLNPNEFTESKGFMFDEVGRIRVMNVPETHKYDKTNTTPTLGNLNLSKGNGLVFIASDSAPLRLKILTDDASQIAVDKFITNSSNDTILSSEFVGKIVDRDTSGSAPDTFYVDVVQPGTGSNHYSVWTGNIYQMDDASGTNHADGGCDIYGSATELLNNSDFTQANIQPWMPFYSENVDYNAANDRVRFINIAVGGIKQDINQMTSALKPNTAYMVKVTLAKFTATGNTNSNTTVDNISSNANIFIGQKVTGSGIPDGTVVEAIAAGTEGASVTSITLSKAATATATGVTLTYQTFHGSMNGYVGFNGYYDESLDQYVSGTNEMLWPEDMDSNNVISKILITPQFPTSADIIFGVGSFGHKFQLDSVSIKELTAIEPISNTAKLGSVVENNLFIYEGSNKSVRQFSYTNGDWGNAFSLQQVVKSNNINFTEWTSGNGGTITNDGTIDFTDYFTTSDTITISGANNSELNADYNLSGATITPDSIALHADYPVLATETAGNYITLSKLADANTEPLMYPVKGTLRTVDKNLATTNTTTLRNPAESCFYGYIDKSYFNENVRRVGWEKFPMDIIEPRKGIISNSSTNPTHNSGFMDIMVRKNETTTNVVKWASNYDTNGFYAGRNFDEENQLISVRADILEAITNFPSIPIDENGDKPNSVILFCKRDTDGPGVSLTYNSRYDSTSSSAEYFDKVIDFSSPDFGSFKFDLYLEETQFSYLNITNTVQVYLGDLKHINQDADLSDMDVAEWSFDKDELQSGWNSIEIKPNEYTKTYGQYDSAKITYFGINISYSNNFTQGKVMQSGTSASGDTQFVLTNASYQTAAFTANPVGTVTSNNHSHDGQNEDDYFRNYNLDIELNSEGTPNLKKGDLLELRNNSTRSSATIFKTAVVTKVLDTDGDGLTNKVLVSVGVNDFDMGLRFDKNNNGSSDYYHPNLTSGDMAEFSSSGVWFEVLSSINSISYVNFGITNIRFTEGNEGSFKGNYKFYYSWVYDDNQESFLYPYVDSDGKELEIAFEYQPAFFNLLISESINGGFNHKINGNKRISHARIYYSVRNDEDEAVENPTYFYFGEVDLNKGFQLSGTKDYIPFYSFNDEDTINNQSSYYQIASKAKSSQINVLGTAGLFSASAWWLVANGFSVASNQLRYAHNASASTAMLNQEYDKDIVRNKYYEIKYTIDDGASAHALGSGAAQTRLFITQISDKKTYLPASKGTHNVVFKANENIGINIVENHQFNEDAKCTKGANWTIGTTGYATFGASGTASLLQDSDNYTVIEGDSYTVTWDQVAGGSNGVAVKVGGGTGSAEQANATATYTVVVVAGSDTDRVVEFIPNASFSGRIDNVEVKPLGKIKFEVENSQSGTSFSIDNVSIKNINNKDLSIANPPVYESFESKALYSNDDKSNNARFKTAAFSKGHLYVGNVEKDGKIYNDRMLKSLPNRFDLFPDGNFIDVNISDGEQIVALMAYNDRILQFKNNTLYVINVGGQTEFLEGTLNHMGVESENAVISTDIGVIWANSNGLYIYTDKGPQRLLNKISDDDWITFLKGGESTIDESALMVGYIPEKEQVLVLNTTSEDIYIYDFKTQSLSRGTDIIDTETYFTNFTFDKKNNKLIYAVNVSSNVTVKQYDNIKGSAGTTLHSGKFELETSHFDFGHPSIKKKVYKVHITHRNVRAANRVKLRYSTDSGNSYTDVPSGSLTYDASNPSNWITDSFSLSGVNNIFTFGLQVTDDGTDPVDAAFEINDISIVYRLKRVR